MNLISTIKTRRKIDSIKKGKERVYIVTYPIPQMEPLYGEEEKKAIKEYLDSGGWLMEFKKTQEFEEMIAEFVGSRYCCVVSNGTISLIAALMALQIGRNDEVLVPDFTMVATANAVLAVNAKPVFVDINLKDLSCDLKQAEEKITKKTKALMIVPINGRYPDMEKVQKFAKKYNLFLIEDAAQAFGCYYKEKHLGSFGDIGSFSFSVPKVITTGQGGALVTDNEEYYQKIKMIKDFGRREPGTENYEALGYNFKFTDLQAIIGIEQMKKLPERLKRKKEMYLLYKKELEKIPQIRFVDTDLTKTSPWFIDILVEKRDELQKFLKERNIGTRIFYPPLHKHSFYPKQKGRFPNADHISSSGLWLPSSIKLTNEEIIYICQQIKTFFA